MDRTEYIKTCQCDKIHKPCRQEKSPDTLIEDLEKAVWYINRYINLLKERCRNAINKLE